MSYPINIVSPQEADHNWRSLLKGKKIRYERKADINGCCIKLMTDKVETVNTFDENFYHLSEKIRSHGRLLVFDDGGENFRVEYEPISAITTAMLNPLHLHLQETFWKTSTGSIRFMVHVLTTAARVLLLWDPAVQVKQP
mgnify:CR=1 FL=1